MTNVKTGLQANIVNIAELEVMGMQHRARVVMGAIAMSMEAKRWVFATFKQVYVSARITP